MTYKTGQNAAATVLRNPANIVPFTLKKQTTSTRVKGIWQQGTPVIIPDLLGSIQDLDGKQRLELPEAERKHVAICVLYETTDHDAVSPLKIGTNQADSDIIVPDYDGLEYAVRVVHDFATYGHLEIYATRLEGQND